MKKAIILPFLLLFTVLVTSCSKNKDEAPNTDKSAEVAKTYQGKLTLGSGASTVEYPNVKIKITRKATNEVILEPVGDQGYPAFAALTFSNLLYSGTTNSYMSVNPSGMIFNFQSNGSINLETAYNFNNTIVIFQGTNVN